MLWNVDFEITSIVFQLIFLVFFIARKHLPTRRNRFYLLSVVMSVFAVAFDVITAVMNSYAPYIDIRLLEVANMIYFMVVPLLSLSFFVYILTVTDQYAFTRSSLFVVFCTPGIISFLLGLTSPFTDFLFYFDESMKYCQGSGYAIEMIANLFYIFTTIAFVTVYRKNVERIERYSIYFFCAALIVGATMQAVFFRWVLLTNAMTAMALIIVYLSIQNPYMYIDKLTGMFNRPAFEEMAKEYFSVGTSFSCMRFTIDDYRSLDTLYGSENVEKALEGVVEYLNKVYISKRLFRLNAYSYILQEPDSGDFQKLETVLRNRFEKPFAGVTQDVLFTISIIIIPYWNMPSSLNRIKTLFEFADRYKGSAKNVTIEVDENIISKMERESAVERAIDNAISNNSIQIYYQPIFSTSKGTILSCEALARLFDDEIGFIPPDEFIPRAEKSGAIVQLGLQIFEKVCVFLKEQEPWHYGMESVHVNLSPIQCRKESLASELIAITDKYGIERTHIDLEITETAAIEKDKVILSNMNKLIDAQFSFSLDDYGTGFSNTATITQLPFANVKIDKSLLWSYFDGKNTILPDLVTMFHNQKLQLIVEGVETRIMVESLTDMKCQFLQGYYFSKPLPQREFVAYVRKFNKK